MKILVTGGTGYIGSHTCIELIKAGHSVVVVDNLSNSKHESLKRVEHITGQKIPFYQKDLLDLAALELIFSAYDFDAVIHFAGLKAVGESVDIPLTYYQNNITGTLTLCEAMASHGVRNLIFSSSATVYGDPATVPITEDFPVSATNPYGRTKLMIEEILQDLQASDPAWNIVLLRYFNPVGAHESGSIGEDPNGIPNNLLPYISQVAVGKLTKLDIFGDDYATSDGTGVRDYIHVVDLAKGHVKALNILPKDPGAVIYNLGTGQGYSVLEMVAAFTKASDKEIPYRIADRRTGDIASCYANPTKAANELGWSATLDLHRMCVDAWRWQQKNPHGYS